MNISNQQWINWGKKVIEIESNALKKLLESINEQFVAACKLIISCQGRVIVTGMGKSGHIGRKIAATLASTGTPAFFVHPAEASHGDLGMITNKDVIIILSNSGQTDEILSILPLFKRLKLPLICITGEQDSALAKCANVNLHINVEQEACVLGLTPTASTTASIAIGDAIAMSVLQARGFTKEDFALSHPGGRLGKRLLVKIEDIMRTDSDIPIVCESAKLTDAIVEITRKCLGMTTIVQKNTPCTIVGIFTDGDLRRIIDRGVNNLSNINIKDVMTNKFKYISSDKLAIEALNTMEKYKILSLPVINPDGKLIGALNMHDLFKAGVV